MLDEKLNVLKGELVEFHYLIEKMIKKCIDGLLNKNADILKEIIEKDEPLTNELELKIDEMGTELIAQFQPKAKNLRIILMILQMNNDLERIGDHCQNIAESALFLLDRPPIKPYIDLPRMAEETMSMLLDSIKSFLNEDTDLAKRVCERDNIVDALRNQILIELITIMSSDTSKIERALHLIRIAQNLERIADLTTNFCEDVIYIVEGKVIKHHKEQI